jgi:hypothetical protein
MSMRVKGFLTGIRLLCDINALGPGGKEGGKDYVPSLAPGRLKTTSAAPANFLRCAAFV